MLEFKVMERTTAFSVDNYYHVFNRGVNKQLIFNSESDYVHFQKLLYTRNTRKRIDSSRVKKLPFNKIDRGETVVDIVAYALMPNHYHLLLHEKQDGGISSFMSKLGTAHAMYMNTKYERTGPLMCRPFRSRHADSDEYLKWLLSYIHLNPLEILSTLNLQSLKDYKFSSYFDYYSNSHRDEEMIIETNKLPFDIKSLEAVADMKETLKEFEVS